MSLWSHSRRSIFPRSQIWITNQCHFLPCHSTTSQSLPWSMMFYLSPFRSSGFRHLLSTSSVFRSHVVLSLISIYISSFAPTVLSLLSNSMCSCESSNHRSRPGATTKPNHIVNPFTMGLTVVSEVRLDTSPQRPAADRGRNPFSSQQIRPRRYGGSHQCTVRPEFIPAQLGTSERPLPWQKNHEITLSYSPNEITGKRKTARDTDVTHRRTSKPGGLVACQQLQRSHQVRGIRGCTPRKPSPFTT